MLGFGDFIRWFLTLGGSVVSSDGKFSFKLYLYIHSQTYFFKVDCQQYDFPRHPSWQFISLTPSLPLLSLISAFHFTHFLKHITCTLIDTPLSIVPPQISHSSKAPFTFLVSAVILGCILTSEDLEPHMREKTTSRCHQAISTRCFQPLQGICLLLTCWLLLANDYHTIHIHYSGSGAWKTTSLKIKAMHLAQFVKVDYMRNLRHSKAGHIALFKAS